MHACCTCASICVQPLLKHHLEVKVPHQSWKHTRQNDTLLQAHLAGVIQEEKTYWSLKIHLQLHDFGVSRDVEPMTGTKVFRSEQPYIFRAWMVNLEQCRLAVHDQAVINIWGVSLPIYLPERNIRAAKPEPLWYDPTVHTYGRRLYARSWLCSAKSVCGKLYTIYLCIHRFKIHR